MRNANDDITKMAAKTWCKSWLRSMNLSNKVLLQWPSEDFILGGLIRWFSSEEGGFYILFVLIYRCVRSRGGWFFEHFGGQREGVDTEALPCQPSLLRNVGLWVFCPEVTCLICDPTECFVCRPGVASWHFTCLRHISLCLLTLFTSVVCCTALTMSLTSGFFSNGTSFLKQVPLSFTCQSFTKRLCLRQSRGFTSQLILSVLGRVYEFHIPISLFVICSRPVSFMALVHSYVRFSGRQFLTSPNNPRDHCYVSTFLQKFSSVNVEVHSSLIF